jgi:homopolymeric O-antigen transport system ATP-binding protein
LNNSIVLSAQSVSKKYKLYSSPQIRLQEALHPFKKKYHKEFWALKDVSFNVPKGGTLGVVGRNGAGKSTLLQIICSVLQPTSGNMEVSGRVGPLMALGAGFNPKFTGRENVKIKGAFMGLSPEEIEARMPEIEAFAEIGEFFDQPMKIYSSGMHARLAFSTAIHVDPDLLVVDEILSVGDAKFRHKCFEKFHEFKEKGITVVLVSHSLDTILKLCDQAIFLENGSILESGKPKAVVDFYRDFMLTGTQAPKITSSSSNTSSPNQENKIPEQGADPSELTKFLNEIPEIDYCVYRSNYNENEYRMGNRRASIADYLVVSEGRIQPPFIYSGKIVEIYLKVNFHQAIENPMFGYAVKTVDGVMVCGSNTRFRKITVSPASASEMIIYRFTLKLNLHPGDYFIDLGVAEQLTAKDEPLDVRNSLIHISIEQRNQFDGLVDLELSSQEISRIDINQKTLSGANGMG